MEAKPAALREAASVTADKQREGGEREGENKKEENRVREQ